jgi:serine/threonine-protein kinase RsbW
MARVWLDHSASSASYARHTVQAALSQAGLQPDDAFDGSLIASELVANAVVHAPALPSGHLLLEWQIAADAYVIAVTDGGNARYLAVVPSRPTEVSGRGLAIVASLADQWGVRPNDGSATVWARSARHAGQATPSLPYTG